MGTPLKCNAANSMRSVELNRNDDKVGFKFSKVFYVFKRQHIKF